MKANETVVQELLQGQKQFRIPLFQRTYSWKRVNWGALWDDIIETHREGPESRHFLGSIVTKALPGGPVGVTPYLVIDGQQRLTTLTILLAALAEAARQSQPALAEKLTDLYLKSKWAAELDRYKVLPTQADRHDYFAAIDHGPTRSDGSLVWQAYDYFLSMIKDSEDGEKKPSLTELDQVITGGLEVVSITLGNDDNEYRIFESLNATGVALTQADLIRNYVFMRVPGNEQDSVYNEYWLGMQTDLQGHLDDFFRYACLSRGEFVREDDVYVKWKKKLGKLNYAGLLQELKRLAADAKLFLNLVHPENETCAPLRQALVRLNRWRAQTAYSFLLNVYRQYDDKVLDSAGFEEILSIIESFLMRRYLAQVPPNALNRLFLSLYDQLPKEKGLVEGTRIALSQSGRRWPTDEEVRTSLRLFKLYINGLPDQRHLVLESLESSYEHLEPPSLAKLEIEHVMPQVLTPKWVATLGPDAQKLHEMYLHTIGNLTLTAYNPKLSNAEFHMKRKTLGKSNVEMNKEIARESKWTFDQVKKRTERLTEKVLKIWPGPVS